MLDVRPATRLHPVEAERPKPAALFRALWTLARQRPLLMIIGAMLVLDAAFILIQVAVDATDYGFPGAYRLSLETEGGVSQFYGWAKAGAAAYLLFAAWRRFRSPTALLWASALAYLGIDDALRLHEKLGRVLVDAFDLNEIGPFRAQDLGELIAYSLILVTALAALTVAETRDSSEIPSMLSMMMVPLVAMFLFFAVVLDTVGGSLLPSALDIAVEDGGELLMLTALFAAAAIWTHQAEELAEQSRA